MANKTKQPITFRASFPPIQSAIKVGTDGMRIQFDVPESEMASAVRLLGLRDVVLVITVEAEPNGKPAPKGDFKMEPVQP